MIKKFLLFIIFSFLIFFFFYHFVYANQIDELTKEVESLKEALAKKESNYQNLKQRLDDIKKRIIFVESEIEKKEEEVKKGEKALSYQKKLLDERTKSYYKNINKSSFSLLNVLISNNLSLSLRDFFYQKSLVDQDKNTIIKIVLYIKNLEEIKKQLEKEKTQLAVLKKEVDDQTKILEGEIVETKKKISQLQQQILKLRLSQLNLPRSALSSALYCTDERKIDPGFSPAFAFFSFGIPHFVGMNQYGAYGRAKAGQDYKTILNAYYQNITIECRDLPKEINVEGYGVRDFEEYVKGVVNKEMGGDYFEALKAQAVAARSYAYGKTSICATQACQVYSDERRSLVNQAVDETGKNACGEGKGEVLVSGGQVISAFYASTFGGYARRCSISLPNACNTSYTKDLVDAEGPINSFDDLFAKAYDRESKCFYSAQGWRFDKSYNNSAWLKSEEVADIVNTAILESIDPSTGDKLFQTDKPPPPKGDNWSEDKVKDELRKRGKTPFNTIYKINVSADFNRGETTNISFSGDSGEVSFSGDFFKKRFNLRAPGYIQIVSKLYKTEER